MHCTIFLLKLVRLTSSGRFVSVLYVLKSGTSLPQLCSTFVFLNINLQIGSLMLFSHKVQVLPNVKMQKSWSNKKWGQNQALGFGLLLVVGVCSMKQSFERSQPSEFKKLVATDFTLTGKGCPYGPKGFSVEITTQSDSCLEKCTNQKVLGALSH